MHAWVLLTNFSIAYIELTVPAYQLYFWLGAKQLILVEKKSLRKLFLSVKMRGLVFAEQQNEKTSNSFGLKTGLVQHYSMHIHYNFYHKNGLD